MHWASQPVLDLGQNSKVQLSSVKDPDSRYEASFPPPVEDMWAVFRAAAVSQSLAVESIACGINAARSAFAFAEQPEAHQQSALMPARTLDYARPQTSIEGQVGSATQSSSAADIRQEPWKPSALRPGRSVVEHLSAELTSVSPIGRPPHEENTHRG